MKTSKEINEISKIFRKNTKLTKKKDIEKSYVQASLPKTSKILKIKENFLKQKIDNIHKIINNIRKPKPKLNITTKSSSRKQVIISISNKNKAKFIESSNIHITNLKRVLKNIKLEVIADFICIDQAGITIVTNKVASSLGLQTIERYVKNTNHLDSNKVETF